MPHKSTLDGLRFLTFFAVFLSHARPDWCPWGWAGVRVFFALSGFLITRILVTTQTGSLKDDLRRFYIRRTLRIFPLYYFIVCLMWATGQLGNHFWFFFYVPNIKVYLDQGFVRMLGHFWTLGVEEQFYVLYPPLLLLTARRLRPVLLLALFGGSVAFQVYAHRHLTMPFAKLLLPYCLSDLACGGLAGLFELRTRHRRPLGTLATALGAGLLVLAWQMDPNHQPATVLRWDDLAPTVFSIGSALLVFGLWRTSNPLLAWPLSIAPVAYLGRISYGLYAWHIPVLYGQWTYSIWYAFLIPQPWRDLALTVGLSALSWHFFEAPINRLKDRYAPSPKRPGLADEELPGVMP